jgi:hypothetical protein
MKNLKLKLITLTSAMALASSAMANSYNNNPLPKHKLNVGGSIMAVNTRHIQGAADKATGGVLGNFFYNAGAGVQAGYSYQVAPRFYIGGELGAQSNSSFWQNFSIDTANTTQSSMVTALVTTEYYFTNNWSINLKAGPAFVHQTASYFEDKKVQHAKTNGIKPYASIGTTYYIGNVGIGLGYSHLFGHGDIDADKFSSDQKMPIFAENSIQATVTYQFSNI